MLNKSLFAVAVVALTPALAFAAPIPAVTKTTAPTAMTQTVQAQKVAVVKHHKSKLAHKTGLKTKVQAKTEETKS